MSPKFPNLEPLVDGKIRIVFFVNLKFIHWVRKNGESRVPGWTSESAFIGCWDGACSRINHQPDWLQEVDVFSCASEKIGEFLQIKSDLKLNRFFEKLWSNDFCSKETLKLEKLENCQHLLHPWVSIDLPVPVEWLLSIELSVGCTNCAGRRHLCTIYQENRHHKLHIYL